MDDSKKSGTQGGASGQSSDPLQEKIAAAIAADKAAALKYAEADEMEKLRQDLEKSNAQITELTTTAKQALADLQNFRRRAEQEQAQFVVFATARFMSELLPILDNFDRACSQVPPETKGTEWFKGVLQIEQQLASTMRKQGLEEIPNSVGKKLDTAIHEAVATGPGEQDVIIAEFEKGYLLGGKVLRPAKVQVGVGK